MTSAIIYSRVKDGIEKAVTILMPGLFGLLIILVAYNLFAGGFSQAAVWLFAPGFSKLSGDVFLAAWVLSTVMVLTAPSACAGDADNAADSRGATIFAEECSTCHSGATYGPVSRGLRT